MSLSIHSIATSPSYPLPLDDPKASWGSSIRSFLFGRVCKDWENSALMAACVAKVFLAALNIFWGTLLMSAFFLLTSAIDAIAIRKLRNFASWNRNLQTHHKNNDFQAVLLFKSKQQLQDLAQNNAIYQEENQRLGSQLDTHQALVQEQSEQVAIQTQLNQQLGQHASTIAQNLPILDQMISKARGHEKEQLEELRKLAMMAKETHDKNAALSATQEQLNLSNTKILEQADRIVALMNTAGGQLTENLAGLRGELIGLRSDIAAGKVQVQTLQGIIDRLDGQLMENAQKTSANAALAGQLLQRMNGGSSQARHLGGNVYGF